MAQVTDFYVVAQYAKAMAEGHPFQYNAGEAPTTGATSLLHTAILALAHALGARGEGLVAFAVLFGAALYLASIPLAARVARRLAGEREGLLAGRPRRPRRTGRLGIPLRLGHRPVPLPRPAAARPLARLVERRERGRPRRGGDARGAGAPRGPAHGPGPGRFEPRPPRARRVAPRAAAALAPRGRGAPRPGPAARAHRFLALDLGRREVAAAQLRPRRVGRRRLQVRCRRAARAAPRPLPLRGARRVLAGAGGLLLPAAGPRASSCSWR